MTEDDLTHGEIRRTLERLERERGDTDNRITQLAGQMVPSALFTSNFEALQQSFADLRTEMRLGFAQVEKTSVERRDALRAKDGELAELISGLEKTRTARAANWIAFGLLALTAVGLIVTVLGQGGR